MPKILPSGAEALIKYISSKDYSYRMIKKELLRQNYKVSLGSICNVINNNGLLRESMVESNEIKLYQRNRLVRTKAMLSNLVKKVMVKNPKSQNALAKEFNTRQPTINKQFTQI